ncbi:MAG: metallophosphoesterase [Clostridia bacterium]|nr:metallophosphoesterase [Clostridia bacterium]
MKKRVISLFLTVFMLISLLSAFPFSLNAAAVVSYVYSPALLIGGETEYNIVWKTNVNSIGYVTYSYGGKTYTVYDERDGVIVSDDYVHSVKVPMEHLNAAGKYTAVSAAVESRTGYNIKLGSPVSKEGKVKYTDKQDGYKIGCFSDIHMYDTWGQGTLERSIYSLNNYMKGVDLITLNGDIASIMTTEKYLDLLLMAFEQFSADGTPILYTAGNHECRGITAQRLPDYFGFSETEDLYGRVKFGSVEFLVTFSGEDKIDEHQEYGDLNAMEHYKEEEYEWYYNCGGFSSDSKYRISISHSHNLMDTYFVQDFLAKVQEYDPDIHINGHTHAQKIERPAGYSFPFLHDGAHDDNTTMRTTLVTLSNGTYQITGFNDSGSVTINDNQTKAKNFKAASAVSEEAPEEPVQAAPVVKEEAPEEIKEEAPEAVVPEDNSVPTAAGVATSTLKSAANTTAFTVKPTVFDGGAYYNVVWQTTPGVDATGEVIVSVGEVTARYRTQKIGKITTDTTHSVRIPKQTFGNCKYEAKARVVIHYTYGGYVTSPPTSYGSYVSAGQVSFKGEPNAKQNKFTFVAIGGTKTQANAEKTKSELGNKNPDMLITLGNMVPSYDTEKDFGNYLKMTQAITGGKYPVMFLRGENETKGAFAAHIGDYIRNITTEHVMGKFYTNTTYDAVSLFGLDTNTAKPDADYNEYAGFDKIRQEQVDWLENTLGSGNSGTYNIVFANADNLVNCAGANFTPGLKNIGANITVTGQSGKAGCSLGLDTYTKVTCGSPDGDGTYGVMLTCADDTITVKALGGEELGVVDVKSSNANNDPSIPNESPDPENGQTSNPESNNPNNNNNNNNTGNQGATEELIKGEYEGVDGGIYIRDVAEGWYKSYFSTGFASSTATPKGNGKTTELEYIHMIAKLSSINLYFFSGSDDAQKASDWAGEYEIYTGYIGETAASDNIINAVIGKLFPAE